MKLTTDCALPAISLLIQRARFRPDVLKSSPLLCTYPCGVGATIYAMPVLRVDCAHTDRGSVLLIAALYRALAWGLTACFAA